ncbi:MAG: SAM-dependent methyltransferase [Herminiimonas sp.]|nr:SAM-dependent methyltransferase [Herminiimonas sp.]
MRTIPVLVLTLALLCAVQPVLARDDQYGAAPPSADGIGKTYMGREIAQVMGYPGADWLERGSREREERPDLLLAALALTPGMAVADVGAGTGYYSWQIAGRIGQEGRVYAVDLQPQMLDLLKKNMRQRGVRNVQPVLGTATDTGLTLASIDLALMVDVYHELDQPREVLDSLLRALRPGGRLVLVEYRAEDDSVPIKRLHKMSVAQIQRELGAQGLLWKQTVETLPWQHIVIFRKP